VEELITKSSTKEDVLAIISKHPSLKPQKDKKSVERQLELFLQEEGLAFLKEAEEEKDEEEEEADGEDENKEEEDEEEVDEEEDIMGKQKYLAKKKKPSPKNLNQNLRLPSLRKKQQKIFPKKKPKKLL